MGRLFESICTEDALFAAWQQIRKKGSAGGIDRQDIDDFEKNAEKYLKDLRDDLIKGRYTPEPYYAIDVPKSIGSAEKRRLGLPTIRDKIAQQAVRNVIEPIFESIFLDVSYGYRPSKGPARAIRRVKHMISNEKRHWVTICDIDSFFDTINHEILFKKIEERVKEQEILNLIKLWVQMGNVDNKGNWIDREKGITQGGIISPLLSNVYLHSFDEFMIEKGYGLVRYSDDFIILSHDEYTARKALSDTTEYLSAVLLLKLNPDTEVRNINKGFTYMGFFFVDDTIKIDSEKLRKIKDKIKHLCITHFNAHLYEFINRMNQEVDGLRNYYAVLAPAYQIEDIEDYMKLQIGILLQKKRNAGHLSARKRVFFDLKRLKQLTTKNYSEYKRYINEILDIAWGVKRKGRPSIGKSERSQEGKKNKADQSHQHGESITRKVQSKKKEYYRKRILTGNLVISTPGCTIGKRRGRIIIKHKRKVIKEIAASKVDHISINTGGIMLSSNLIKLCLDNRIPIDFFDFKGQPIAKLYLYSLCDAKSGIAQLKAFQNGKCYHIAASIVEGKINNQINLLKYYLKYRKKVDPEFTSLCITSIEKMESIMDSVSEVERIDDMDLYRQRLMAKEGQSSSIYWNVVKMLLRDDVEFTGRKRQGATDLVNSCLNYGYSMLYPRIWQALIQAGLNPMISYLHKEQENKPTLTFDMIEEFRHQIVDRTIFAIFTRGTELHLTKGYLSTSAKQIIIDEILKRLKTETRFRKHRMTFEEIIFHQAKALSDYLNDRKNIYNPFVWSY